MFINPNPRQMSLVQPVVALFYSIFKNHDIEMQFFDTTFYDVSDEYVDSDLYVEAIRDVKKVDRPDSMSESAKKGPRELEADFRNAVESFQPHVVMVSALESTVTFARNLLRMIRDLEIPHVLGGVFATYAPELALSYDEVDVVCVGEAEEVIVPLVKRIVAGEKLDGLAGIWTKDRNGSITKSPIASPFDLNKNPRFDATPFQESRFYRPMHGKMYKMIPIETHRGCPLKCTFCNSPIQNTMYKEETGESYFRGKTIQTVMKDVLHAKNELKAEYLFFWADNFLAYSKTEIDEFCEAYSDVGLPFYAQSYPTTLNEYKLKKLVGVGLDRLGMGMEHGNEEFRKRIVDRPYPNSKAIEQVKILQKYDIQYSLANIVGFPTETPELHMDTVRLNRQLNPFSASCSTFTPFHGTPLRKLALEEGYLSDPSVVSPTNTERSILNMPQFTADQIQGKARTFNLYLKFPENRWNDIERAEALTKEGDKIWSQLTQEYDETYGVALAEVES